MTDCAAHHLDGSGSRCHCDGHNKEFTVIAQKIMIFEALPMHNKESSRTRRMKDRLQEEILLLSFAVLGR
jgi:hypothetical protein